MSIITTILRAIGIYVVPPVYLDSKIDVEVVLDSEINTDYDRGLEI